jgi:hypothetical protein
MAQHGSDGLGGAQAVHGHVFQRVQRLFREYYARSIVDVYLTDTSSLEMAPAVTMKDTTGSVAVSTTW